MKVAVLMTCFNEGPYIGAAVRSVLDQTRSDVITEILIADDGSAAETLERLEEIRTWDPRISVHFGRGSGISANRNRIAKLATADLLAILDGDDIWLPHKLELQLEVFRRPDVGLCYAAYYLFSGENRSDAHKVMLKRMNPRLPQALAYFENDPPIVPSTMIVRREAYWEIGGFDPAVPVFEDTDFALRAAEITRFAAVDEPLIYKRTHPASITAKIDHLMLHHAMVAFRFAGRRPEALPRVPARLAMRAAKLGNMSVYAGDFAMARRFYRFALAMKFTNVRALLGWVITSPAGAWAHPLLKRLIARRVDAASGIRA